MSAFDRAWSVVKDDDDTPKWNYKWDSPKSLNLLHCKKCGYSSHRSDFRVDGGPRDGMMRCPICREFLGP